MTSDGTIILEHFRDFKTFAYWKSRKEFGKSMPYIVLKVSVEHPVFLSLGGHFIITIPFLASLQY